MKNVAQLHRGRLRGAVECDEISWFVGEGRDAHRLGARTTAMTYRLSARFFDFEQQRPKIVVAAEEIGRRKAKRPRATQVSAGYRASPLEAESARSRKRSSIGFDSAVAAERFRPLCDRWTGPRLSFNAFIRRSEECTKRARSWAPQCRNDVERHLLASSRHRTNCGNEVGPWPGVSPRKMRRWKAPGGRPKAAASRFRG